MSDYRYQYGSSARTLEPVYRREDHKQVEITRRQKRREKISFSAYALIAGYAVAIVFAAYSCFQFLQYQVECTVLSEKIAIAEKDIYTLKAQNDAVEYEVGAYTEVSYIYDKAIEELGMVEPEKGQVIYCETGANEYLIQSGNIPKE